MTGIAFKAGEDWLDFPQSTLDVLMSIHQGGWLGKAVRPFYVAAIGIGLLVLAVTGLGMTGIYKKFKKPARRA